MKVLITGGAGFIGSHLAEHLLGLGHLVTVIDDLSSGSMQNLDVVEGHANLHFHEEDVTTWPGLDDTVLGQDLVVHLAAVVGVRRVMQDALRVIHTNCAATEKVLAAVAASPRMPRTLIASSSEVYGLSPCPSARETDPINIPSEDRVRWTYAATKAMDEFLAAAYFEQQAVPVTALRLFNVVGPRQTGEYGMVVPSFIRQAIRGEPLTVHGDGMQTRSFCDVRDTVEIIRRIGQSKHALGGVLNVGRDEEVSILQLAHRIIALSGSTSILQMTPHKSAYKFNFEEIRHRRPSLERLHEAIDLAYNWSLEDTLNDLIRSQSEEA